MPRQGEGLQRLVHALEQATHNNQSVTVESPKFFPDKHTGQPREHDVVLTFTLQHHVVCMALECRDRNRKVGVPEVEAFHAKCQATGVDRGIIVSSAGFYKTALNKAGKCNIGCLTLLEVEGFNWCLTPGMETSERRMLNAHFHIETAPGMDADREWRLSRDDVDFVDHDAFKNLAIGCLNKLEIRGPTNQPVTQRFELVVKPFTLVNAQGVKVPVTKLTCDVTYEVVCGFIPFDFRQYIDNGKGRELYSAAVASIELGEFQGELMI